MKVSTPIKLILLLLFAVQCVWAQTPEVKIVVVGYVLAKNTDESMSDIGWVSAINNIATALNLYAPSNVTFVPMLFGTIPDAICYQSSHPNQEVNTVFHGVFNKEQTIFQGTVTDATHTTYYVSFINTFFQPNTAFYCGMNGDNKVVTNVDVGVQLATRYGLPYLPGMAQAAETGFHYELDGSLLANKAIPPSSSTPGTGGSTGGSSGGSSGSGDSADAPTSSSSSSAGPTDAQLQNFSGPGGGMHNDSPFGDYPCQFVSWE